MFINYFQFSSRAQMVNPIDCIVTRSAFFWDGDVTHQVWSPSWQSSCGKASRRAKFLTATGHAGHVPTAVTLLRALRAFVR